MLDKPFLFKVSDSGGRPSLLLQVFYERGWVEYREESSATPKDKWNLWWRVTCQPFNQQYKALKAWQFVNRIPDAAFICKKDHLARSLKTMRGLFGAIYDFSPMTYIMPIDYTKLVMGCSRHHHSDERIWICKPVGRSQGRGITVFRKATELVCESTSCVVQEYVKDPLLIGGYKFDLRLYVCVPCYHPLAVYVYREGLARFGTARFSLSELDNRCAHLTNSSINKHAPGYLELKDKVGAGCKWSLRQLRVYLQQNGMDDWLMWQRISQIIVLTVASQISTVPATSNCFEFYGFDILIDSSLKPWLIEVNNSPALCSDCDLDPAIKKPMLHDLLDLLGLPICNTGLSLVADWGDPYIPDDRPLTPRAAVTVIRVANKWKKQISPSKNQKSFSRDQRCCRAVERRITSCEGRRGRCGGEGIRNSRNLKSGGSKPAHVWENGLDWGRAPEAAGGWVRVYPLNPTSSPAGEGVPQDARTVVAAVSRNSRSAKAVFAKLRENDDSVRDKAMGMADLWHPTR